MDERRMDLDLIDVGVCSSTVRGRRNRFQPAGRPPEPSRVRLPYYYSSIATRVPTPGRNGSSPLVRLPQTSLPN